MGVGKESEVEGIVVTHNGPKRAVIDLVHSLSALHGGHEGQLAYHEATLLHLWTKVLSKSGGTSTLTAVMPSASSTGAFPLEGPSDGLEGLGTRSNHEKAPILASWSQVAPANHAGPLVGELPFIMANRAASLSM